MVDSMVRDLDHVSECAICGHALTKLFQECPRCFPDAGKGQVPSERWDEDIVSLIKRARGLVILGCLVLGWLLQPWAYLKANQAWELYRLRGVDDRRLAAEIGRVRSTAAVLTFVYLAVALWWGWVLNP